MKINCLCTPASCLLRNFLHILSDGGVEAFGVGPGLLDMTCNIASSQNPEASPEKRALGPVSL